MRQLVYTLFITNNHDSFHLWWKENLVKHQKVLKYYGQDCRFHYTSCKVKSVSIRSFSGPYFPAFGLNSERYTITLRIQSECGKTRTRKTPDMGTFHAINGIKVRYLVKATIAGYLIFYRLILFESLIMFLKSTIKFITGIFHLQN